MYSALMLNFLEDSALLLEVDTGPSNMFFLYPISCHIVHNIFENRTQTMDTVSIYEYTTP